MQDGAVVDVSGELPANTKFRSRSASAAAGIALVGS